ncbi:hypothetical protein D5086_004767 [Populus alba]|uniref:Uncharacterized protein n=1 Tax=Populus alba TaxID=43335 RepID=A0ACC4CSQ6_POPAL
MESMAATIGVPVPVSRFLSMLCGDDSSEFLPPIRAESIWQALVRCPFRGFPLIFVIWVLLKSSLLGVHAVELPYDETIVMSEWMVPQEESESSDSDHGKSYKRIKASSLSSFTALSCTMR